MSANDVPNANDYILQAREKIRNSESLHRRVLLEESLKKWAPHDNSSSDDSSSDDEEDDGAVPVPAIRDEVGDEDGDTSPIPDVSNQALPYVSEDEAGPPCKRRRLEDLPDEETFEPSPGTSGYRENNWTAEDDAYHVQAAPFPDWLDVDGAVFEEPVQDPDLSFLDDL
ncbi:hypothetical protein HPB52_013847 [Rhipicephalus sanguineus]|uniref:Uncharacterized protein n=1 Tax=Rhipicephalus sanguineus TaxID=34632 RepID=A0A9D4SQH1_RHISA|nr:hypothetical protein HPB52_013847 [Rhipicephalus sanguineus]